MIGTADEDAMARVLASRARLELGGQAVVENCIALREFGVQRRCDTPAGRYECPQRALCDALRTERSGARASAMPARRSSPTVIQLASRHIVLSGGPPARANSPSMPKPSAS